MWFEQGEWKDVPKGMGVEGEKLFCIRRLSQSRGRLLDLLVVS